MAKPKHPPGEPMTLEATQTYGDLFG